MLLYTTNNHNLPSRTIHLRTAPFHVRFHSQTILIDVHFFIHLFCHYTVFCSYVSFWFDFGRQFKRLQYCHCHFIFSPFGFICFVINLNLLTSYTIYSNGSFNIRWFFHKVAFECFFPAVFWWNVIMAYIYTKLRSICKNNFLINLI